MSQPPAPGGGWSLPALVPWSGTDWATYEDRIYRLFVADFLMTPVVWRGQDVSVARSPKLDGVPQPMLNGKEEGFWHVATETGPSGLPGDRVPNLDRCARIPWIKAVLNAPPQEVRTFGQIRQGRQHFGIALPDFSYIVFLRQWPLNVQLVTAYCVDHQGKRDDYRKQWIADKR